MVTYCRVDGFVVTEGPGPTPNQVKFMVALPAAFNNLVGLKPTRGLVPTEGVVPACRSLDCVSVFAKNCREALEVYPAGYLGLSARGTGSRSRRREKTERGPVATRHFPRRWD